MKTSKDKKDKSIKLSPNITAHDLEHKIDHAVKLLEKGHKIKFQMVVHGRQRYNRDNADTFYTNLLVTLLEDKFKPMQVYGKNYNYYFYTKELTPKYQTFLANVSPTP